MNDKIKAIEIQIAENAITKSKLEQALLSEWYTFLASKGIQRGSVVTVKSYGDKTEAGILQCLYIKYGEVRPQIAKMKKDGKAHVSASVFCFDMKDIVI